MDLIFPHDRAGEIVLEKHISVKAAAEFSGYNIQYLRRLLRTGRLEGIKIGQVWLIKLASLEAYARNGQLVGDRRHGPRRSHRASGGAESLLEVAWQCRRWRVKMHIMGKIRGSPPVADLYSKKGVNDGSLIRRWYADAG